MNKHIKKIAVSTIATVRVLALVLLFPTLPANAQTDCLEIEWEHNYGGSLRDWARSIRQTDDGGYIVAGYSESIDGDVTANNGSWDFWILKLDELGELEWEKSYGGSDTDQASEIWQTTDGGYIVAGASTSSNGDVSGNNGGEDVWIIKLNATGDIEWDRNFGGSDNDRAETVQQTTDGGYIVAGYSDSQSGDVANNYGNFDYWMLKLDATGNLVWEKNYGGTGADFAYSVTETTDGGFALAGSSFSVDTDVSSNNGLYDYWIVKTDANGNIEWESNLGGEAEERAYHIAPASDGGYIIGGYTFSVGIDVGNNNGGTDYWIVKIDANGNFQWENTFGGAATETAFGLQEAFDGGYILAGYALSSDGDVSDNYGNEDYWLVKLSVDGFLEWEKNFGGTDRDRAYALRQANDGGYIMVGYSESDDLDVGGNNGGRDYWVVKLIPIENTLELGNDTLLCTGATLTLDATQPNAAYEWQDGSTNFDLVVSTPGEYSVQVFREGCIFKDTIDIFYPTESLNIGNDTLLCAGESVTLDATLTGVPNVAYQWQDGTTGPLYEVSQPGTYTVEGTLSGCTFSDEIEVAYTAPEFSLGEDVTICGEGFHIIDPGVSGASFMWSDGSTGSELAINESGTYWVETTIENCLLQDTVAILFKEIEAIDLGDNTVLCEGQVCLLDATRERATYRWQDDSTDSTFLITGPGEYWVEVRADFCLLRDTIIVTSCESCMHVPNAFTPNFDGNNDFFRPISGCELTDYNLQIYNRYGLLVFESNAIDNAWSGMGKDGTVGQNAGYVYVINYAYNQKGQTVRLKKKGGVLLIR